MRLDSCDISDIDLVAPDPGMRYCAQEGDDCQSPACSDTFCTALGGPPKSLEVADAASAEEVRTLCLGAFGIEQSNHPMESDYSVASSA